MIEAVNSVVANAPLLRGSAEPTNAARSNTSRVQEVTSAAASMPQAPFISPFIFMDVNFDQAVLQIRDPQTGDVVEQIPSRSRMELQQRSQTPVADAQNAEGANVQQAVQAQASSSAFQAQAIAQAFSQATASQSASSFNVLV